MNLEEAIDGDFQEYLDIDRKGLTMPVLGKIVLNSRETDRSKSEGTPEISVQKKHEHDSSDSNSDQGKNGHENHSDSDPGDLKPQSA